MARICWVDAMSPALSRDNADTDGGGHTVDRVAVVGSTASDDAGDWQGWEQFRCDDGESCAVGHQMASRQVLPWDKQGVRMEYQ